MHNLLNLLHVRIKKNVKYKVNRAEKNFWFKNNKHTHMWSAFIKKHSFLKIFK